ncbi:shikimate kinase [Halobacillus andaensis]|uniref:Shikimate kinase n=1 Tax=Halobacillus andaensis TaxID=1176239 RepID=A0A917B0A3_HALAA|nr:shikimate kinase [Halobacillus andaensis]MBP2003111.1 shikimate kinase [Halobacillus andaensis]GGF08142.1 shikimate kinase [Halobacillus andaensis]
MIFLIGYMGSGKSTVARELSDKLNMPYIEMDEAIEQQQDMSIPQIFNKYGEAHFRKLETDLLKSLQAPVIVSTGGGVILASENQEILKKGTVIFLDAAFETIDERLSNDQDRPLWTNNREENRQRYEKRLPIYRSLASHVIQVDHKETTVIINEVLNCLKS